MSLQIASDGLKGRVFDVSLADLQQVGVLCSAATGPVQRTVLTCAAVQNEADAYRKMLLRVEEVQGKFCLTNFWVRSHDATLHALHMGYCLAVCVLIHAVLQGMDFTADKLRSLVRKWQTLIEAHVDIKTTDGYLLRMFCIGFTKKRQGQVKKTCYAQTSQIRQIRKKMTEIMVRESSACDLKDLVSKFIPEAIGAPAASAACSCT